MFILDSLESVFTYSVLHICVKLAFFASCYGWGATSEYRLATRRWFDSMLQLMIDWSDKSFVYRPTVITCIKPTVGSP